MKKLLGIILLALSIPSFAFAVNFNPTRIKLTQLVQHYRAQIGIAVIDKQSNDTLTINNATNYPTQSVYKFPLAIYALKLVEAGKLSLNQVVTIPTKMSDAFTWSPMKRQYSEKELKLTVDELIYYSVSYSDNLACDMLFELVGGPKKVTSYLQSIGIQKMNLAYTELQIYGDWKRMYKNTSTPFEMSLLLKKFEASELLTPQNTAHLMDYMTDKFNSPARIQGNLPPHIKVAHKTGTGSMNDIINACNDVGIITLPNQNKIFISVFVKDSKESFEVTEQLIANIAQIIYETYEPKPSDISLTNFGNNASAGNYITLNEAKHYYETYGSGKPLLLIHGNSTATKSWAAQIEFFSKYYKVYSIDCRGRGKSELGNDSLTYMQQANDLDQFIKKLQLDSVDIIGKSDGAIVGLLMAIHYPDNIKKLVAFSGNVQPDSNALYPKSLKEINAARVEADNKLALNDTTANWKIVQQRNRMMEFQPNITATDLQKISIPVLVISGDRDLIKISHSLFIYENLQKGNFCILPNQQHGLPRLNPTLFNTTVKTYLDTEFKPDSFRFEH